MRNEIRLGSQRLNVYVDGELKGKAMFRGTSAKASLTQADLHSDNLAGRNIEVEFSNGEVWEYLCLSHIVSTRRYAGVGLRASAGRLKLVGGHMVDSNTETTP